MQITLTGTLEEIKAEARQLIGEDSNQTDRNAADAAKWRLISSKIQIHGTENFVEVKNLLDCAEKVGQNISATEGQIIKNEITNRFVKLLILK